MLGRFQCFFFLNLTERVFQCFSPQHTSRHGAGGHRYGAQLHMTTHALGEEGYACRAASAAHVQRNQFPCFFRNLFPSHLLSPLLLLGRMFLCTFAGSRTLPYHGGSPTRPKDEVPNHADADAPPSVCRLTPRPLPTSRRPPPGCHAVAKLALNFSWVEHVRRKR